MLAPRLNLAFTVLLSACAENANPVDPTDVDGLIHIDAGKTYAFDRGDYAIRIDPLPSGSRVALTHATGRTDTVTVAPPTAILWSPSGRVAAINDGEGSGQTSILKIIAPDARFAGGKAGAYERIAAAFVADRPCGPPAHASNVWAVRWSADEQTLVTTVSDYSRSSCAGYEERGIALDVTDGSISEVPPTQY